MVVPCIAIGERERTGAKKSVAVSESDEDAQQPTPATAPKPRDLLLGRSALRSLPRRERMSVEVELEP
jgi:hypothetical protein